MIIQEIIGNEVHTYSDNNVCIKQIGTGATYEEAWDPIQFKDERQYEETDEVIQND